MKVTVLGTGLMGGPMARRLATVHDVTIWNRTKAKALVDVFAVAATPKQAAAGAQVVVLMLMDGAAVREVLDNALLSAVAEGGLIVNMGSIEPETDRAMARHVQTHGLTYLDAPVSGGVAGAQAGTLAILVGGCAS